MRAAWRAIRDRLKADEPLAAFFQEHYPQTPLQFFLGYKVNRSAAEFPYIAVAPTVATFTRWPKNGTTAVAIIVGINEPAVDEGESRGLIRIDEALPLVLAALDGGEPLATRPQVLWLGQARITSDMGITHPYYEGEVSLAIDIK
jgi:hypothetical protein